MTQKEKVISYITKYGVITTADASNMWILDLQSVIRDLKNDGYTIYDGWKKSKNSHYKVYALNKKQLEANLMG